MMEKWELDLLLAKINVDAAVMDEPTQEEIEVAENFCKGNPPRRIKTKCDGLLSVWRLWQLLSYLILCFLFQILACVVFLVLINKFGTIGILVLLLHKIFVAEKRRRLPSKFFGK